jgi:hypothetical protein
MAAGAAPPPADERNSMDVMLHRIERLNYLFGGLLVIAVVFTTRRDQALGAAVGVALTCLNFAFLRRLVFKWTSSVKAGDERGGSRIYLILPKMVGLMGAVVLALWLLPIDAVFFVAGYSVFIISIVVAGAMAGLAPASSGGDDDSTPHSS